MCLVQISVFRAHAEARVLQFHSLDSHSLRALVAWCSQNFKADSMVKNEPESDDDVPLGQKRKAPEPDSDDEPLVSFSKWRKEEGEGGTQ